MTMLAGLIASPMARKAIIWGLLILGILAAILLWRRGLIKAGRMAERLEEIGRTNDAITRKIKSDAAIGALTDTELDKRLSEQRATIRKSLLRAR